MGNLRHASVLLLMLGPSCEAEEAAVGEDGSTGGSSSSSSSAGSSTSSSTTHGSSNSSDDSDDSGTTGHATTTGGSGTSAPGNTTGGKTGTTGTTSGGVLGACGNDVIDPGEACDDGNTLDGDTCSSTCAIPFEEDWAFDAQSEFPDNTSVRGTTVDADGNTVLVGSIPGTDTDVFLAALSPEGTLLWQTNLDIAGAIQWGTSVAMHPSGDFLVAGSTYEDDDGNAMLMRVDADTHAIAWVETYDGPASNTPAFGNEQFDHVVAMLDGSIVVVGDHRLPSPNPNLDTELVFRRYGASGDLMWSETLEVSQGYNYAAGLVALDDGALVMLVGNVAHDKTTTQWLWRFTEEGVLVQTEQLDVGTRASALTTDAQEDLYVAGTVYEADVRPFAAKFDQDFAELWRFESEFPDDNSSARGIAVGPDQHVFLTGHVAAMCCGDTDVWVAEVDESGAPLWATTYGTLLGSYRGEHVIAGDGGPLVIGTDTSDFETNNIWIRKFTSLVD